MESNTTNNNNSSTNRRRSLLRMILSRRLEENESDNPYEENSNSGESSPSRGKIKFIILNNINLLYSI